MPVTPAAYCTPGFDPGEDLLVVAHNLLSGEVAVFRHGKAEDEDVVRGVGADGGSNGSFALARGVFGQQEVGRLDARISVSRLTAADISALAWARVMPALRRRMLRS